MFSLSLSLALARCFLLLAQCFGLVLSLSLHCDAGQSLPFDTGLIRREQLFAVYALLFRCERLLSLLVFLASGTINLGITINLGCRTRLHNQLGHHNQLARLHTQLGHHNQLRLPAGDKYCNNTLKSEIVSPQGLHSVTRNLCCFRPKQQPNARSRHQLINWKMLPDLCCLRV